MSEPDGSHERMHATIERISQEINALGDQRDELRDEGVRLRAKVVALEDALVWCSGSADFGEGGKARKGWLLICAPLLENLEAKA